jgi:large subunit ribosomal protein L5
MTQVRVQQKNFFTEQAEKLGYSNPMQSPRIEKVIVSAGTGSIADKNKVALIEDRLSLITGQKPAPRQAKKSIASFKLRQGDVVGYQVTLRGKAMYGFLDKLINIAIPRTKDFRGFKRESVDEMGNLTIGISEHTIFPETSDEELKDVFGLAITIVTTATNRTEALSFFEHIGIPFKKEATE